MNFSTYKKKRLIARKADADVLHWLAIGFFVALFYAYIPASECQVYALANDLDMQDFYLSMCEAVHAARCSALAWICFSILRIPFLISHWRGGPILRMYGLKMERRDGKPFNAGFAARIALLEWLPFHILSLYVFAFGISPNLFAMGSATALTFTAQLIWLAPMIFKYKGRNIAEFMTGADIAFTPAKETKIEKAFQRKWKRNLTGVVNVLNFASYSFLAALFIFMSIQILRAPNVNPEYERLLYADNEPVWENNVYFALEGLTAPAAVTDSYEYGRAKVLQRFKHFEALKKLAHIPYVYAIPEKGPSLEINKDMELKFRSKDWKDLSCLYLLTPRESTKPCATMQDYRSYIKANQIIWDRFNALPDYRIYNVPPQQLGSSIIAPLYLGMLKAAHIIELAEKDEPEKAFKEWARYMTLYKYMAGARESMVLKAVMAITIKEHYEAFENLLYLHPELAKTHGAEIREILKTEDNALFRTDYLLSDDTALVEPILLGSLGNINAIRNDLYECILNFQEKARTPLHEYPFGQKQKLCQLQDTTVTESALIYPLLTPGYIISNIIQGLIVRGTLKGEELITNMKLFDVSLKMALVGVQILEQGVKVEDVPAFLSQMPGELQNPLTLKPFEWDAENKALFYIKPHYNTKTEFRLNLRSSEDGAAEKD